MARHFPSPRSDANNLENAAGAPDNTYPYALSIWAKHSDAGDFSNAFFSAALNTSNNCYHGIQSSNDKALSSESIAGSGTFHTGSNGEWTPNVWNHWFFAWRGTADRKTYLDGVLTGHDNTTELGGPPSAYTRVVLGIAATASAAMNDGELAEAAWIRPASPSDLDGMEVELASGADVAQIGAGAIRHLWRLYGLGATEPDEVGGLDLTVNGAVTQADHPPRVWYPAPRTIFIPSGVAPVFVDFAGAAQGVGDIAGNPSVKISFIGATSAVDDLANSVTVFVPAFVEVGDLLLLITTQPNGPISTPPRAVGTADPLTSWTLEATDVSTADTTFSTPALSVYFKIAESFDTEFGQTYTPSITVVPATPATGMSGRMLAYRGVDQATPFDAPFTTALGASANPDPPAITTVTDRAMVIPIAWQDDNNASALVLPTDYTDPGELGLAIVADGPAEGNGCATAAAHREAQVAGGHNPAVFGFTASGAWGTATFALRPSGFADLAGLLQGVGDIAGTLVKFTDRDFAGVALGVGDITGTADTLIELAGTLTGLGDVQGTLDLVPATDLAGSLQGVGVVTGTLAIGGLVDLAGAAIGAGDSVGTLVKFEDRDFAGLGQGAGVVTGTLDLLPLVELAGTLTGAGVVAGTISLQGFIELAGVAQGVGTVSGTVSLAHVDYTGAMAGVGTILGTLAKGTEIQFAGAAQGVGTINATLDKAGVIDFAGLAQGVGDIVGFMVKTTPVLLRATEPSIVSETPAKSAQSVTPKRSLDPLH